MVPSTIPMILCVANILCILTFHTRKLSPVNFAIKPVSNFLLMTMVVVVLVAVVVDVIVAAIALNFLQDQFSSVLITCCDL